MKRESGYYWVKYNNKWIVAEYGGSGRVSVFSDILGRSLNEWQPCLYHHYKISEHDIEEINEIRIKNPDEK